MKKLIPSILSIPVLFPLVQAEVDFAHQVVPVLKEHCAKCHMDTAKKGGFSMNTRESLVEGSLPSRSRCSKSGSTKA
jgi:hypothetical protein